jgi:molybdopterin-guanine dinucleotide biosynthesis protein A
MIHEGDFKIQHLVTHSGLSVEIIEETLFDDIDPYRQSFMNINTPADLELARKTSSHSSLP